MKYAIRRNSDYISNPIQSVVYRSNNRLETGFSCNIVMVVRICLQNTKFTHFQAQNEIGFTARGIREAKKKGLEPPPPKGRMKKDTVKGKGK